MEGHKETGDMQTQWCVHRCGRWQLPWP